MVRGEGRGERNFHQVGIILFSSSGDYPFFFLTGQLQKTEILNRKQINNRKKGSVVKDMIKSLLYELIQDNGLLANIVCSAAAYLYM